MFVGLLLAQKSQIVGKTTMIHCQDYTKTHTNDTLSKTIDTPSKTQTQQGFHAQMCFSLNELECAFSLVSTAVVLVHLPSASNNN